MMTKKIAKQGEFTGRHMAIIMVSFFGVIIAVNLTMATLASRSWTGLVVKNSYVESQKFNSVLQQSREQAALNWTGEFSQSASGVKFELRQADGKIVEAEKIVVILRRPATEVLDQLIPMKSVGNGSYSGDVKLDGGAWSAEIRADILTQSKKSNRWQMTYNIYVKDDGSFSAVTNKTK